MFLALIYNKVYFAPQKYFLFVLILNNVLFCILFKKYLHFVFIGCMFVSEINY